jgi:predicted patatin/cPLA2 family phospholipase
LKEKQSLPNFLGEKYFKNHPGLTTIFSNQHVKFNESIDFILNPPTGIKIQQIAPEQKLKTGGYTNSKVALELDYRYGLEKGLDFLNSLK